MGRNISLGLGQGVDFAVASKISGGKKKKLVVSHNKSDCPAWRGQECHCARSGSQSLSV